MPDLPEPIILTLVRHAEAAKAVNWHLTRRGHDQARRLAKRLADEDFDHIYSSDLPRALETAGFVRRHHRRTPYTVSKDLREIGGARHFAPNYSRLDKGAKALLEKERRTVKRFLRRFFRTHSPGDRVLAVIHGTLIRYLLPTLNGIDPRNSYDFGAHNTCLTVVHLWKGRRPWVGLVNCVKHLA
jgi:probable phosphoglycerate mutase